MKVTQTFGLHFEIGVSKYDFKIDAENIDEAKAILVDHLTKMIEELKK